MLEWRNSTYVSFTSKIRIIRSSIRKKSSIILICLILLLTSVGQKSARNSGLDKIVKFDTSALEAWKEISVPGQVRTARVLKTNNHHPEGTIKTILLWTKYFGAEYSEDFYFFQSGEQTFRRYNCRFSNCFVTSNRSLLSSVDAVLFHAKDLNFSDIPERENDHQIWILYNMESPSIVALKWNFTHSLFNWTMTYRSDSDIQVKYGETIPLDNIPKVPRPKRKKVFERTKGAIWFVSNCNTKSRREAYVSELEKLFPVDVYGKCGRTRCEPSQSESCYKLLDDYKYYLSFENSICKEYVTEKFFNILHYDIIPVVLGGANYSSISPQNSYVDATNFPDPARLAKHLTDIAKNSSWYDSFFEWKKYYGVHLHTWMCDLCMRLHEPNLTTRSKSLGPLKSNLWSWWVSGAFCRTWTTENGFKSVF